MHRPILLFILAVSPVLLGSNRQIFWSLNSLLAAIALVSLAVSFCWRPIASREQAKSFVVVACLLLGATGWMLVQAGPGILSSWNHPLWDLAAPFDPPRSISINPSYTLASIAFLAPLSLMLVAVIEARDPRFFRHVLAVTASTAVAIAVFGAGTMALDIPTLGLIEKTRHFNRLGGTFPNENNAATYFGFGLIAALTLTDRKSWGSGNTQTARLRGTPTLYVWLAIATLLFAAVVMTGSRGGLVACAAGLAVLALVRGSPLRAWLRPALGSMLVGAVIVILAAAGSVGLFARADTEASTDVRLSLYGEALAAIRDRPIAGHGAGTYRDVQPLYHREETPSDFVWTRAHSTYLESVATLGIPAVAILIAAIGWMLMRMVEAARRRPSPQLSAALPIAAIAAVHSAVDFSLQIQAVAITCCVFLGAALGSLSPEAVGGAESSSGEDGHAEPWAPIGARREQTLERWIAAALSLLLAAVCTAGAARTMIIEIGLPRTVLLAELRPFVPVAGLPLLPGGFRDRTAGIVDDPYLTYASVPECQATVTTQSGEHAVACLAIIGEALRRAPASPALWLRRAELLAQSGETGDAFWTSVRNSYLSGPREGYLAPARLTLLMEMSRDLPPDIAAKLRDELARAHDDAITAVAQAAARRPAIRAAIGDVIAATGDPAIEGDFIEAIRAESDTFRRAADRARAQPCLISDPAPACTRPIDIVVVAEAQDVPARFRLWVNGTAQGEYAAIGRQGSAAIMMEERAISVVQTTVASSATLESVEIEFINDRWDRESGLDLNLRIVAVGVDGREVPLSDFSVPYGSEQAASISNERILIYRNGSVRMETTMP